MCTLGVRSTRLNEGHYSAHTYQSSHILFELGAAMEECDGVNIIHTLGILLEIDLKAEECGLVLNRIW